jgi:Patatin-like phospholipase
MGKTVLVRIKIFFKNLYFSLPLQLLIMQARHHKFILLQWLFLFLAVSQSFGVAIGIPYLFLEPEYMGDVSFWSLFIMGCGAGAFIAAFQIATYIQDAYQFHFLVLEKNPFSVFVLNNSLLPLAFVSLFSYHFILFQINLLGGLEWIPLMRLGGFFIGLGVIIFLVLAYFAKTNKNIFSLLGEKFVQDELQSRRVILAKAKATVSSRIRVEVYLKGLFRGSKPDPAIAPDFRGVVRMLNQNHGNAMFVQLLFLGVIILLGLLERHAFFQFPAGASILVFFSVLLMLTSAFTFWFRKLGPLVLLFLGIAYFVMDRYEVFQNRHQALGMNYETAPAPYNADRLYELTSRKNIKDDIADTQNILDQWKQEYSRTHGGRKPKIILLCTSGGGLRAGYFTFRCLQSLDSLTHGAFMDQTRFISGASGGMIGAAYFRELMLMKKSGQLNEPLTNKIFADRFAKDLLNRISFKAVTGLFFPSGKVQIGSHSYPADRGWSFDDQLIKNLNVFHSRRLGDYELAERKGLIPILLLSPVVMNDGRKLIVSPLRLSWLCRTLHPNGELSDGITGIEFKRYFAEQEADSLLFATALRMNASFPFITPYIQLPSDPPMRIIDAGIADNLGMETASRFIYQFHKWIMENTDGVLIVQIRDYETHSTRVPKQTPQTLISDLLDPIGATYNSFALSKDISGEGYIDMAHAWVPGKIQIITLEYARLDPKVLKASLSWHLTDRERNDLEQALFQEHNQESFKEIRNWLIRE